MDIPSLKFNNSEQPEFFKELRRKVNLYFKENDISIYANWNMKLKTAFMLCLYFVPLGLMLAGQINTWWVSMLMWLLMGFGMSGIGASVMHDANHGAYSKNKTVNRVLGFLANFVGAYHVNWKIQHNVLHHSFTNVDGLDEDISNPVMRLSPHQDQKKIFKYQKYYAPFFYGIMTLYWLVTRDFALLVRYNKKNLLAKQGLTLKKAMVHVSINKVGYVILTLVLPLILVGLPWWQVLSGFLLMHFLCGLFLALIFQPAHVTEKTDFFEPSPSGSVENNWAIHQMKTTANFAHKSIFFSWFIGGLNYQIEHHLFPNICHIHYKKLSKIVKETAQEFDLPYYQYSTFLSALQSHFNLLDQLGKQPTLAEKS